MKFWINGFGDLHYEGEFPLDAIGATKESLRAWKTRLDTLKQGQPVTRGSSEECALCYRFYTEMDSHHCSSCPLYRMQGNLMCGTMDTPWAKWHYACTGNATSADRIAAAEGMVSILEKTLAHLVMESDSTPQETKAPPPSERKPLVFGGIWKEGMEASSEKFYLTLKVFETSVKLIAVDFTGSELYRPYVLSISQEHGIKVFKSLDADVLEAFGGGDEEERLHVTLE
jgi:hypothetical protein